MSEDDRPKKLTDEEFRALCQEVDTAGGVLGAQDLVEIALLVRTWRDNQAPEVALEYLVNLSYALVMWAEDRVKRALQTKATTKALGITTH